MQIRPLQQQSPVIFIGAFHSESLLQKQSLSIISWLMNKRFKFCRSLTPCSLTHRITLRMSKTTEVEGSSSQSIHDHQCSTISIHDHQCSTIIYHLRSKWLISRIEMRHLL
ncbi:hypothetical protein AAHA92_33966 [Salvia divinorum]|uniref:Uncharacterized protein n=1 Tax=Salvia divinorum TaxID=28513 RepID=A0ABD1FHE9_SALDI